LIRECEIILIETFKGMQLNLRH